MTDRVLILGNIYGCGSSYAGNIYDTDYLAPTIMTAQGGNREPMIVVIKDDECRHKDA